MTWVVIASGPSLVPEDVERVREAGCTIVAVNTSWKMAPFCDYLFAGDNKWWQNNKVDIPAKRVSLSYNAERHHGAKRFKSKVAKKGGYNSGCVAIEFAIRRGAERVILLGFDCSVKNGTHWHGDHKKSPNPNQGKCEIWKRQFATLRNTYRDSEIINCSRYTELKTFPRMSLEEALCGPI